MIADKTNWLMFKNFIHNELGITRDEIYNWIKDEVEKQTKQFCEEKLQDEKFIKRLIQSQLDTTGYYSSRLKNDVISIIKREISNTLMKQIEIDFLPKIKEESVDILKCT